MPSTVPSANGRCVVAVRACTRCCWFVAWAPSTRLLPEALSSGRPDNTIGRISSVSDKHRELGSACWVAVLQVPCPPSAKGLDCCVGSPPERGPKQPRKLLLRAEAELGQLAIEKLDVSDLLWREAAGVEDEHQRVIPRPV